MQADPSTADPRARLVLQMQASRGELARLFAPPAPGQAGPGVASGGGREGVGSASPSRLWRSGLWFLRRWWRGHPLHAPAEALQASGREWLAPVAATRPWALLGGAALCGGVLAWAAPRSLRGWALPVLGIVVRRAGVAFISAALR